MENRRFVIIACFYLLGVGILTGMLIERVRFDEARSDLFSQLEEDTHEPHERLMEMERETAVKP
jgi:hypothetical protein